VHSENYSFVEEYLQKLPEGAREKTALMVVPRYHGHETLMEQKAFCGWLQKMHESGHEIFIHGFHHNTQAGIKTEQQELESSESGATVFKRSMWGELINKLLVNQEAEFCGLKEPEKTKLVQWAIEDFRQAGLPVYGFVAPAWYGNLSLDVLARSGFRYSESRCFVYDVSNRKKVFAPPLIRIANRLLDQLINSIFFSGFRIVRFAVHPEDRKENREKQHIGISLGTREPARYCDL
jgi:predicted deacetylase